MYVQVTVFTLNSFTYVCVCVCVCVYAFAVFLASSFVVVAVFHTVVSGALIHNSHVLPEQNSETDFGRSPTYSFPPWLVFLLKFELLFLEVQLKR